jgi:hypothetical protein
VQLDGPGVRITTARLTPPSWISSGSSRATRSAQSFAAPSRKRVICTDCVASVGTSGAAKRSMGPA